ncbi:hypothetical protein P618_200491 [Holospora obtusa F1]|uniref:Uncharacterized protein n=1 Tax=Holospora obtusa F1 TaxID=1399147 RepID=W6THE9_HOLOB|nr:hypothetical protein P618_200491 [Holospora obtusa F1]
MMNVDKRRTSEGHCLSKKREGVKKSFNLCNRSEMEKRFGMSASGAFTGFVKIL